MHELFVLLVWLVLFIANSKEENGTSHQKQRFGWLIIEMLINNLLINLLTSFINTKTFFDCISPHFYLKNN